MRLLKHEVEETKLRAIFASSPNAITVTDLNGNITECNQATLDMHGYSSKEELIGKSAFELVAKKDHKRAMENLKKTLEQGSIRNIEYTFLTKDGREFPAELSASVIKDPSGNPTGFVAITKDITERKKAEEALRESEAKFRNLAEQSPNMIFINKKGRVVYANKKCEEIMGYKREEFYSPDFDFFTLIAPESIGLVKTSFSKHMKDEEIVPYEYTLITKEGKRIEAILTTKLITYEGESAILGIVTDITERKRAEEELVRLSTAVNISIDGIIICDMNGNVIDVNEAVLKKHGIPRKGDMIGKNAFEFIAPEDLEKLLVAMREMPKKGYIKGVEYHIITEDGSKIPVEANGVVMKGKDGKPIGFVATVRDITERKKAEKALKEGEQKLRDIIDTSPDGIVWVDTTGKITLVNKRGFELTGYSANDLIGKNFMDVEVLTPESKRKILEAFVKRIKGINTPPYEIEFVAENGEIIPIELSASPIYEGGKIVGTQSILRDLRERKVMERKLQEYAEHLEEMVEEKTEELRESQDRLKKSEEMYRLLVESSNDGISIVDFEGKILFANRKLKEMYGYEEMEGMNIVENIHPDVREEVIEEIQKAAMTGEIKQNFVVKVRRKDGNPFWIETNTVFVKENGKPVGFLAVTRDITERKRMEERLLKSERLAAIGEVATMVGHDLRNPLQSIENATFYLNNELPSLPPSTPIPQKAIEILQIINDSVNYADKIIRDLHDFSAAKKPILKKTNINTLVKEVLSQLETPENIELITELDRLPKIKADKDMIKRVFLNLAMNGIQAMKKGGTLKVSTKKTKEFVEVSFKDTGVGMSKENMKKLFTLFFTTKAKGMGMGLAICKKLVNNHDGSIEVESEEEKGSTFTVRLPIQQENGGENRGEK